MHKAGNEQADVTKAAMDDVIKLMYNDVIK